MTTPAVPSASDRADPSVDPRAGGSGRSAGAAVAGFLAGGGALLVLLVGSWIAGANGLLELIANGLTAYVPVSVFDAILRALGPLAKGLLFAAIAAAVPLAGAVLAWALARFDRLRPDRPATGWSAFLAAVLVAELVALPIAGVGLFGLDAPGSLVVLQLAIVAAAGVYAILLVAILRQTADKADDGAAGPARADGGGARAGGLGRRAFLAGSAAVLGAVALVASGVIVIGRIAVAAARPLGPRAGATLVDAWGVSSRLTPVDRFYTVAKDLVPPSVDGSSWRLEIDGLVDRPGGWTADQLRGLPRVAGPRTLQCISNEVVTYGSLIGNQQWSGVRVRDLLDAVGVRSEARFVHWQGADGFTESSPLDVARDGDTWLVDEMAGAPLPQEHGFPLRVLIAGRYGMKQPKWLTRVTVADTDEPGYWVKRGWDEVAAVRTYSRIDAPKAGATVAAGDLDVYGVASAGDRGVARVEVSADDGATWTDAELEPATDDTSDLTWRRWRARVRVTPGRRQLLARATDGQGGVQDATERPPLPSGATGLHRVGVDVLEA